MRGSRIGERLVNIRRLRMWTQGRLAQEAGVSPTTVSGIETGKIVRPHFGTLQKLARALDIDPQSLLLSEEPLNREGPELLSLRWARSVEEEEFEQELEEASLDRLKSLARELKEERERLKRLYGEFPEGSEQRQFIKCEIRNAYAQFGSITTSMMFHADEDAKEYMDGQKDTAGELRREGV